MSPLSLYLFPSTSPLSFSLSLSFFPLPCPSPSSLLFPSVSHPPFPTFSLSLFTLLPPHLYFLHPPLPSPLSPFPLSPLPSPTTFFHCIPSEVLFIIQAARSCLFITSDCWDEALEVRAFAAPAVYGMYSACCVCWRCSVCRLCNAYVGYTCLAYVCKMCRCFECEACRVYDEYVVCMHCLSWRLLRSVTCLGYVLHTESSPRTPTPLFPSSFARSFPRFPLPPLSTLKHSALTDLYFRSCFHLLVSDCVFLFSFPA